MTPVSKPIKYIMVAVEYDAKKKKWAELRNPMQQSLQKTFCLLPSAYIRAVVVVVVDLESPC